MEAGDGKGGQQGMDGAKAPVVPMVSRRDLAAEDVIFSTDETNRKMPHIVHFSYDEVLADQPREGVSLRSGACHYAHGRLCNLRVNVPDIIIEQSLDVLPRSN